MNPIKHNEKPIIQEWDAKRVAGTAALFVYAAVISALVLPIL